MIVESLPALSSAIEGIIVKPLAVSSPRRLPQYPDLPTIAETIPILRHKAGFLCSHQPEPQTRLSQS